MHDLTVILPPILSPEDRIEKALEHCGGSLTVGNGWGYDDGVGWGDGDGDGYGDGEGDGKDDGEGDGYGDADGDGESATNV